MKKFIVFVMLLLPVAGLHAEKFVWDLSPDERIEMVKTARIKYYINSRLSRIYDERNIIDLTCVDKSDRLNRVHGVFSVHEKDHNENTFKQSGKFLVDFLIEPQGRFVVKKTDYMPNLRHIPTFPSRELKINDSWKADAELVLDNFSRPFKLTFPVQYTFERVEKEKDLDIGVINYNYSINTDMSKVNLPGDFPVRIMGENKGVIYWDLTNNRPKDIKDLYKIIFIFRSGRRSLSGVEFHMDISTINSFYKNYTPKEKETARDELKKEIPKGMDVDVDKRGLVVTMGDLLFDFDSSEIRNDTRSKLNQIGEILKKKYPDREIIIEGHTDNVGSKTYNYKLSERRARSVSELLKSKLGHDKFSYRGFGQEKPLADNSTKDGRRKNRRVEIIIKLN